MKKPLLLFIIAVILFVVAKVAYNKYCESRPEGCKKENLKDRHETPEEGVDW